MPVTHDEFVTLLTSAQMRLYAFICTLVIDRADADEVLQETNLALWQQSERFQPGTDFLAWACRVAHFRVLRLRDLRKRERVQLDDTVIELLATESIEEQRLHARLAAEDYERRRLALVACLEELSERNRSALTMRYQGGHSLTAIGDQFGRTANAVAQLLHRIRSALRDCVDQRLAESST